MFSTNLPDNERENSMFDIEICVGRMDPESGAADVAEYSVMFSARYPRELASIMSILGAGYVHELWQTGDPAVNMDGHPTEDSIILGASSEVDDNPMTLAIAYWTPFSGFELTDDGKRLFSVPV